MHRIDGPGATVDNRFTDGDPVGGVQATIVTDDWANDVQEELISVLADRAITPVKGVQNQLLTAIKAIFGIASSETVSGSAKIATQAQANAGTDDATIISPKKLRAGFSISLGLNGYLTFPTWMGGLIIQWGQSPTAVLAGGGVTITLPIAFPNTFYRGVPFYDLASPTSVDVTTLVLNKNSLSAVKINNTSSNTTTPSFLVWGN